MKKLGQKKHVSSPDSPGSYTDYCDEILRSGLRLPMLTITAVIGLYSSAEWYRNPAAFRPAVPIYAVQILSPLVAWYLGSAPLRRQVQWVALGADAVFTFALIAMMLQPTTTTDGAALAITMKMMGTAALFAWSPRSQWISAGVTLAVYWCGLWGKQAGLPGEVSLHHVLGPFIGAMLSVAGMATVDRGRRAFFQQSARLANAEAELRHKLDALQDRETRLRLFVEQVPAALWSTDTELNYTSAVGRGLTQMEIPNPSAIRSLQDYFQTEDESFPPIAAHRRALRGESSNYPFEWNGRSYDVRVEPLRDATERIIGTIGIGHDITALREAEAERERLMRALREEAAVSSALARAGEELMRNAATPNLLEHLCELTTSLIGCDGSHTILWDEKQRAFVAVAVYGYTAEQREEIKLLRLPASALTSFHFSFEGRRVVSGRLPMGEPTLDQLCHQYGVAGGISVGLWCRNQLVGHHTAFFRGDLGEIATAQKRIMNGIAGLAVLAIENSRLLQELEAANRLKSEFLAAMSHELRTPLNAIIGYTDLLIDGIFGPLTHDQYEPVERISFRARDLHEMISSTLDLSRLESGQLPLDLGPVDFRALARELESDVVEPRGSHDVTVEWEIDPALPVVRSDALKLKVIIKNILSNALKFTDRGHVRVSIRAEREGVLVSVVDTGIGVAPDDRDVMFEPFRQVGEEKERWRGGVGLGLFIVRRLTEILGGKIRVESQLGAGTTFQIWVPVNPPLEVLAANAEQRMASVGLG